MASAREWITAIRASKVATSTLKILGLLLVVLRIDWSFEYAYFALVACLIGAVVIGLVNKRLIKRGKAPIGFVELLIIVALVTAAIDILA